MLIQCDRHTKADLAHWHGLELTDRMIAARDTRRLDTLAMQSVAIIRSFVADGSRGYLGVSWGKDSVATAHLALCAGLDWPLVWVRVDEKENPHCPLVRDAFFAIHRGVEYHEINAVSGRDGKTSRNGFLAAQEKFGDRYISGVRRDESQVREMRYRKHGANSKNTCAPLSNWTAQDVFSFCAREELPLHPVYAMTAGGRFERAHIRTAAIGGLRGALYGRREWERIYYRRELEDLGAADPRV